MKQEKDIDIAEASKAFIKKEKALLIEKFANLEKFPPLKNASTIFMAGSPGAGKTEFSLRWIKLMTPSRIVRIDADEIKKLIPYYNGENSDIVQGAAGIGVEKIYDYVLKNNQSALMDGTFSNYNVARKNIQRSLERNRKVGIFYIYQDPIIAWDFTKKREKLEGRYMPKEAFIQSFFNAKENIKLAKKEFGDKMELNLVIKDSENKDAKIKFNIKEKDIDKFIKITYSEKSLNKILC
jgi:UDP-N-acetylglucosamine kinase